MLYAYYSNQLDVLEGILANRLQAEPASLFSKEVVLVQSKGMAQWLKLKLAERLGVAAQIDFPMPSSFIWKLFNGLYPHLPEQSDFDKEAITLKLYKLLQDKQNEPVYEPIKHYLSEDESGLALYKLSEKIADLFDQYLVYRPDWLLAWEQGEAIDLSEQQHSLWQKDLWHALVELSQNLGQSTQHRAKLLSQLSDAHTSPLLSQKLAEGLLPKRIFVFSISALPASYWRVLQVLSEHIDVHFFILNPCQNYWQDLDSYRITLKQASAEEGSSFSEYYDVGNPLLSSWGKMGRDFLSLIHQSMPAENIQDISAWAQPGQHNLLGCLQQDILNLNNRAQSQYEPQALENSHFKTPLSKDDGSLSVVSAHSELREVQHLHDRLWHWFLEDKTLEPKDILVMTPDVNRYAPFINAVFSNAKSFDATQNRYIPWAVSDQSMSEQAPLLESLLSLFNLPKSRFGLQEILDLLNTDAVLSAFNLSVLDVQQLQKWLNLAGVRWGLDDEQRASLGAPMFAQNSWLKGIRQLLLGYVSNNTHQSLDEDWAIESLEGQDAELADGLIAFITRLRYWYEYLSHARAAQDWVSVVYQLMDDFFTPDEQETLALQFVRENLEAWQARLKANQFNDVLSHTVVYEKLASLINQQGGWQRFLTGKVNVCTLMPMRSIPFKIICLLGMNDSDYPRKDMPVSFDLMRLQPKQGDRSPEHDDRYLFLEAITCAQEKLYISYRGREARKNNEQQPSVLVSELLDYIGGGFCLADDVELNHQQSQKNLLNWLVTPLALQPFSPNNFNAFNEYSSFDELWFHVAQKQQRKEEITDSSNSFILEPFISEPLSLPNELDVENVSLNDLFYAHKNSAQFFLTRRLNIPPSFDEIQIDESEPFSLMGLEQYNLKEAYFEQAKAQNESISHDFLQRHQSLGLLPVFESGKAAQASIEAEASLLLESYQQHVKSKQPVHWHGHVDIANQHDSITGNTQIHASIYNIYDDKLIRMRVGRIKGDGILRTWLELCVLVVANVRIEHAKLVGVDKGKLKEVYLSPPSFEMAYEQLQQALGFYWACWQSPPLYFVNEIWQVLNAKEPDKQWSRELNSEFSAWKTPATKRVFAEQITQFLEAKHEDKLALIMPHNLLEQALNHQIEGQG